MNAKKPVVLLMFLYLTIDVFAQNYELVWADEFDYNGLPDSKKWSYEVGYIRNHELQYYTRKRIENSVVKDNNLMLIGRRESYKDADYTSASLYTLGKFSFKYGKILARMKLPVGQGIWPAFWMMGENRRKIGWPKCGEIDIMEHINTENRIYGTAHWDINGHVQQGGRINADVIAWHDYSLEWNGDSIRWFLDGNRYYGFCIKEGVNDTHEFHKAYFILVNLAIGGGWPKNPDATTVFPDSVFVDYIRVYQEIDK